MKLLGAGANELHRKAWFAQAGDRRKKAWETLTAVFHYWRLQGRQNLSDNKGMSGCIDVKTNKQKPNLQKTTIVEKNCKLFQWMVILHPQKFQNPPGQGLEQPKLTLDVRSLSCFEQGVILFELQIGLTA